MASVSIKNLTRQTHPPRALFNAIATHVLPRFDISLVFLGPAKARALNIQLRGKTYIPNVLSYASSEKSGEIFICPREAGRQAPTYDMSTRTFILYLFIHGLLHLKGGAHGVTMERCERKLVAKFAAGDARTPTYIHVTKNRNRHRHRHLPGKSSRRRGTLR
ncbi:MAG: rRNA maturation RNase YbeY [Minisyncoccota bacterium]